MIESLSNICLLALSLSAAAALYRIIRGPTLADRIVGADLATTCAAAIMVVYGISSGTRVYMDAVVVLAALGFFASVAMARYLLGGRAID
mgnify:CR=1 FL=1